MFESQRIKERRELLRWFTAEEISWLQKNHPDLARIAANPNSGTQSIFSVQNILDQELYKNPEDNIENELPDGFEFLDI